MRKVQKRQIEEIIRQMEEAHNEIKRCMEKGSVAQSEELLADCQNAAVAIGTLIEETEGEGHFAVTVLEEYCELVYQIHEAIWHKIPLQLSIHFPENPTWMPCKEETQLPGAL